MSIELNFGGLLDELNLVKNLELKTYLIITYLNASNKPQQIKEFLNYLLEAETYSNILKNDSVVYFQRLKECLLKSSPLCGFPYVINSMNIVNEFIETKFEGLEVEHALRYGSENNSNNQNELDYNNGTKLFGSIYDVKTEKLTSKLATNSQDMKNFIIQDIYGKLLSNFSLLSFEETELIVITSLLALNVPPQLKSHLIGAKNAGISKELLDQLQEVFKSQQ
ncbi:hypothetical protein CONCODRAFT_9718 [Conidiobolus coronatus NRRL 28638]|uniref:Carboxymuconolactone decarboxylase-like domain-containing protein n=1 Tax=Conidiobolus coronatus (strain ATCC 28846 / CBS 209.66 / NRRL 28638) TaxID=796925 RepID=A0A137NZ56_CONC2|nr:hypothetical protein CONCODRAFT_9718 [Conidiobolus coronatus NRRL 28638]|eukprot:KXN68120.1 hypothetical protein CONCODRAFT_9718 [Conidiobolus coronatus NRRL 28638]